MEVTVNAMIRFNVSITREGNQKKGAVAMRFDGNHFGIYTVGEFAMKIVKIICLAAPAGTGIDDFKMDFLFVQIYKCHQSEPWRKTWVGL